MKQADIRDAIQITIDELLSDLTGKGIYNNKNYYFKYVLPTDIVEFIPMGRGKRAWNKILSFKQNVESSEKCKHFRTCGGCRAQHIPYAEQFRLKTAQILDYYAKNWNLTLETKEASRIYNYRNRMDFAVFPEQVGLREEGNFRKIVEISECQIQSEKANRELKILSSLLKEIAYNRKSMEGFLKYLTIRYSNWNNELLTILTFTKDFKDSELEPKWIEMISKHSIAENIIFCYNRRQSEVSAIGEFIIVKGNSYITEKILDKELRIPFDSFFQTNPIGFLPILEFISNSFANFSSKNLVDLFCGSGFFSLLFGERFETILGWDISESSIQMAREQKSILYPEKNIQYEVKNLYNLFTEFHTNPIFEKETLLILDPPRAGIGKEMQTALLQSSVLYICYVSCNPYSQIEDLEALKEKYIPLTGLITDPYPHTPHLESVLFLQRKPI